MSHFKFNPDTNIAPEDFGREVLFELKPMGNAVQITAIDVLTGVEASIVAGANLTPYSMKANAMRKLAYVLSKMDETDPLDPTASSTGKPGRYA